MAREVISDFLFKLGFDASDVDKGLRAAKTKIDRFAKDTKRKLSSLATDLNIPVGPSRKGRQQSSGMTEGQQITKTGDIQRLEKLLEKTERAVGGFSAEQEQQAANLRKRLAGIAKEFGNVKTAADKAKLGNRFKDAREEVRDFTREVNKASRAMTSLDKISSRARSSLLNFATGFASVFAAVELAGATLQLAKDADSIRASFDVLLGGAEQANQEIEMLRENSDKLGISFAQAAPAYRQFLGAAKDSLGLETTRDVFLQLSEATTIFGANAEQSKRAFTAVAQIASKGTVSMEELRQQLAESGALPNAIQLGADAMNMAKADFIKAVSTGKIASEEFLPKFAAQLKQFNKEAEGKGAKTLQAALNRLANAINLVGTEFAESGFIDGMKVFVDTLASIIKNMKPFFTLLGGVAQGLLVFATMILKVAEGISYLINLLVGSDGMVDALQALGVAIGFLLGASLFGKLLRFAPLLFGFLGKATKGVFGLTSALSALGLVAGGKGGKGGFFGGLLGFLPKILTRFIPFVGWALLLFDIFKAIFGLFDDAESKPKPNPIDHSAGIKRAEELGRSSTNIPVSQASASTRVTNVADNSVKEVNISSNISDAQLQVLISDLTRKNDFDMDRDDL